MSPPLRLGLRERRRVLAAVALALAAALPSGLPARGSAEPLEPLEGLSLRLRGGRNGEPDPVRRLWLGFRFDVNAVSAEVLSVVPGIGPALSQRIVEDRDQRGPFRSLAEVERVKGVGPALRGRLERYAEVVPE